jgi:hypothetical protein
MAMSSRLLAIAALGITLSGCGVYGPKGNDTGGIIPWSPENEKNAFDIAQANCGYYKKYAVATSISRAYGDYIAYSCMWDPPKPVTAARRRHVSTASEN